SISEYVGVATSNGTTIGAVNATDTETFGTHDTSRSVTSLSTTMPLALRMVHVCMNGWPSAATANVNERPEGSPVGNEKVPLSEAVIRCGGAGGAASSSTTAAPDHIPLTVPPT